MLNIQNVTYFAPVLLKIFKFPYDIHHYFIIDGYHFELTVPPHFIAVSQPLRKRLTWVLVSFEQPPLVLRHRPFPRVSDKSKLEVFGSFVGEFFVIEIYIVTFEFDILFLSWKIAK